LIPDKAADHGTVMPPSTVRADGNVACFLTTISFVPRLIDVADHIMASSLLIAMLAAQAIAHIHGLAAHRSNH